MSINTITIADLKTTVSNPEPLYYITNRNKEGVFWLDNADTSTAGNDATVIVTNAGKRYKRIYDGPANVLWFGVSPTETPTNNTTAFQNAINQCSSIFIPEGIYTIKYPIVIPPIDEQHFKKIIGAGIGATKIIKEGNNIPSSTLPSPSAPNRPGFSITDNMNVDACFILNHSNNNYTYNITISNLSLACTNNSDYAIYAPRNTHFNINNINTVEFKTGYFTYDTWTAKFEMIEFIQSNSSSGTNYSCFYFADDTSGFGTGTTCTFFNCLAVGYNIGFDFYGLTYSSILDSSSVNIKGIAYKFNYCHQLNIISCGAEAVELDRHLASVFLIESSELNIQGFYTYSITSTVTGGNIAASIILDTSNVNIENAKFVNFTSVPANTFNIVIQNSTYLWSSNLVLPTNGNNFISYTSDSAWLKNSINGTEMLGRGTLASATSPVFQFPQVDSQPTSAAAGTTIFNTSVGKLQTWDGTSWNDLW